MGFQEENAETIPSETPCKPIVYVIVQFLNWLNFISKLVQYFKVVHFFLKQFNFLNWFIFFWRTVFFLTGTLKKKRAVLHISLSPLSPVLITLSFCVPTLPPLLILPKHFFHSKTNNFYLHEISTSTSTVMLECLL